MTSEDNYNAPQRSISEWVDKGYTLAYATLLYKRQAREANTKTFYSVWNKE